MRDRTSCCALSIHLFLLFSLYDQVGARTSTTSTPSGITWTSPTAGSTFSPGDMLIAEWSSPQAIPSPSFRLCFDLTTNDGLGARSHDDSEEVDEDGTGNEEGELSGNVGTYEAAASQTSCGDASWPVVHQTSGSYITTLVAPSTADQANMYIQMEDDSGRMVTSPRFSITSSPPTSIQSQNEGASHSTPLSSPSFSDPPASDPPPVPEVEQDPPMTNPPPSTSPSQSTADASSNESEPPSSPPLPNQSSSDAPTNPEAEQDPPVVQTPPLQPIVDAGTKADSNEINPISSAPPSSPPSSDSQPIPEDEQDQPIVTRTHASHSQPTADTNSDPSENEPASSPQSLPSSSSVRPHSSSLPSAPSSPPPNLSTTRVPPPTAAYAIPLALVGVVLIGATALVAYQRRNLAKAKAREVEAGLESSEDEKQRDGKMGSVRWGSVDDVVFFCDSLSRSGGRGQDGGIACVPPVGMRRPTTREAFSQHHSRSYQAAPGARGRTASSTSTIQNPKVSVKWRVVNMPDDDEMHTIPLSPLSSRSSSPVSPPSHSVASSYSHSSSHSSSPSRSNASSRTLSLQQQQRPPHSPLSPYSVISSYFDADAPHKGGGSSMSIARYHTDDNSSVYSHGEASLVHTRRTKRAR